MQVDNPLAALEAVRRKLGAAIICEEALRNEKDKDIMVYPLEGNRYFRNIAIAVSKDVHIREHIHFIDYLKASC